MTAEEFETTVSRLTQVCEGLNAQFREAMDVMAIAITRLELYQNALNGIAEGHVSDARTLARNVLSKSMEI